jgi:hypothetical protein
VPVAYVGSTSAGVVDGRSCPSARLPRVDAPVGLVLGVAGRSHVRRASGPVRPHREEFVRLAGRREDETRLDDHVPSEDQDGQ